MSTDSNLTFNLSVSTSPFPCKPTSFDAARITYETKNLNLEELEKKVKEGYAFCYNFFPTDTGILTQSDRHIDKFDYTNTLFFDFDKMPQSMTEFISSLSYKPSLAYTTYSNGTDGKYSYRLIYAFRLPICTQQDFENIYWSVANANGFKQLKYPDGTKYGLDYRKVNQQYYGGGDGTITYHSDNVYLESDFNTTISNTVNNNIIDNNLFPFKNKERKGDTSYSQMESSFINDLYSLPSKAFLDKYRDDYERVYLDALSTRLTLSPDGTHFLYPDNYMEIKHKIRKVEGKVLVEKWTDGEERRKKLYIAAKILLNNYPEMSPEQLIYCLIRERNDFYDNSDKQLRNDIIVGIAKNAFEYRDVKLKSIKHPSFKVNKEYWKEKGYNALQASRFILKEQHLQEVLNAYDFSKSVKENQEVLKELGIKAGKSYLYNLKKKYAMASDASIDEIPFKNKDKEDTTSCSQMESLYSSWVIGIIRNHRLRRNLFSNPHQHVVSNN